MTHTDQDKTAPKPFLQLSKNTVVALVVGIVLLLVLSWPVGFGWWLVRGALMLVAAGVAWAIAGVVVFRWKYGKSHRSYELTLILCCSLVWLVYPVHNLRMHQQIEEAEAYCNRLLPLVDSYHQEHGVFLKDQKDLNLPEPVPRLLRQNPNIWNSPARIFYRRYEPDQFIFVFRNPLGYIPGDYLYSNESREWSYEPF